MTRLFRIVLVTAVVMSAGVRGIGEVHAQCSSCATPTVAYAPVVTTPVVAAPTVTYSTYGGWYPGRMFDRLRMNRWGVAAATPTYVGAYAPTYTAAYAPAYTAAYAPAAPYVTAYAPLQRTVVSYAPMTVYSPAILEPVVSAGCSTCVASPCSTCVGATTVVEQAAYVPAGDGCSTCAEATSAPYYPSPSSGDALTPGSVSAGPPTPQPQLNPNEPTPAAPEYGVRRPETDGAATESENDAAPKPLTDEEGADGEADDSSAANGFQAPPLLGPQNDRTANRPTVDIHNAVYRRPVRRSKVSATTVAKPVAPAAGTDANGWRSVAER